MAKHMLASVLALLVLVPSPALGQQKRPLVVDDIYKFKDVGDPRVSPDGAWVAYTVTSLDAARDARNSDIYMAPMAGGPAVQMTRHAESETTPRWSPDGRYLAFLSKRDGKKTQVWLLDRHGGEPVALTDYKADVSDLAWSPDGARLALIVGDVDPDDPDNRPESERSRAARPIVIRRLQFKRDGDGYLSDLRSHVHVFEVASKTSRQVTEGPYDDSSPAWSPDGQTIVFVSNRTPEPDSNENSDLFAIPAAGGTPTNLTRSPETESAPAFSPDGRWLTFLKGGKPEDIWYAPNDVIAMPAAGGEARSLTNGFDRFVWEGPRFTPDGKSVVFIFDDAGNAPLARVPVDGGSVERIVQGDRAVEAFDVGAKGEIVVLESSVHQPSEISRVDGGALARITRTNDDFLGGIDLGPVERFRARSADGTMIDAFLTRPPGAPAGSRLPTLLRIHGGPVGQYSASFELEWQMLAAHGYAIVAANPRGSSGYGRDFSIAIWADWGGKDYDDVMAAVDEAIKMGVANPDRLGVGGWSYGGILTNAVIAKTGRFKAAASGASEVNYTANYGHDHYQREWEAELGLPWRNTELWNKLSPFFQVERITTPTLLLCGQEDWNVPLLNSEQLYQALRRLGKPTELIIYPGQSHSIRRPSYLKDRYERYLAWYDKYVKGATPTSARPE